VQPVLVNIGCGATWHPSWMNLDVRPVDPRVQLWDAAKGLPFETEQVDVCYASHLLEHLTPDQARALLVECLRVLRRGGIIRLAVPDLEGVAREYLRVLAQAESGDRAAVEQYKWIVLELLDQLVRDRSGGEMERYLRTQARGNAEYVTARIGPEALNYMDGENRPNGSIGRCEPPHFGVRSMVSAVARRIRSARSRPGLRKRILLSANGEQEALRLGQFRLSGECHRWMYDRFSLRQLLEQCGFSEARTCSAFESRIDRFASFGLDIVEGRVRKPDSLFMEAIKP